MVAVTNLSCISHLFYNLSCKMSLCCQCYNCHFTPAGVVHSIWMSTSVCLFVCLSFTQLANHGADIHQIFVHVANFPGSVLLCGIAICYVLRILRMMPCFHIMALGVSCIHKFVRSDRI